MAKVSPYRRIYTEGGYRNIRVEIVRGRRPASLVGPFYARSGNTWQQIGFDLDEALKAVEAKQALLVAKEAGVAVVEAPADKRVTVAQACALFLEAKKNKSTRSKAGYRHSLGEFQQIVPASSEAQKVGLHRGSDNIYGGRGKDLDSLIDEIQDAIHALTQPPNGFEFASIVAVGSSVWILFRPFVRPVAFEAQAVSSDLALFTAIQTWPDFALIFHFQSMAE
jgi:hypothetical protein